MDEQKQEYRKPEFELVQIADDVVTASIVKDENETDIMLF